MRSFYLTYILKGELLQDYTIRLVKKRIRNMYIRIVDKHTVLVTAPYSMPDGEIRKWVNRRRGWIEKSLAASADRPSYRYMDGEIHNFLGERVQLSLVSGSRNGCCREGHTVTIFLKSSASSPEKIYQEYCRQALAGVIRPLVSTWSERMGVRPAGFRIRRVKTRWGSCNIATGELTFALDLITKPLPCIEAVVVHELNHLLDGAHDRRFHQLMAYWIPDYRKREKALNSLPREFV